MQGCSRRRRLRWGPGSWSWLGVGAVLTGLAFGAAADPESEAIEYDVLARNSYDASLEFAGLDRFPDMKLDPRLQAPGIARPERLVVSDEPAWRRFWSRANPELAQRAAELPIDFAREVVLISAAGARQSRADQTVFVDLIELPDEVRAVVEETGGACPGEGGPSHPLAVVRMARSAKPIHFDVRTISCAEE